MLRPDCEDRIRQAGLKVTPQRINVLNILLEGNHPSAEEIMVQIRKKYSSVSTGTIYHILDVFVDKGLITKVPTEGDAMRYDAILENHHHLLERDTGRIYDFFNDDLTELIQSYFDKNPMDKFEISEIKINLLGQFKNKK